MFMIVDVFILKFCHVISDEKFSVVCYKSTREKKLQTKLKIIFIEYKTFI